MRFGFFILIAVVILLYGSINFYIGHRGMQAFGGFIPPIGRKIFWVLFGIIAFSYIIGRLSYTTLPKVFVNGFTWVGAYWIAAMVYLLLVLAFIDLLRLMNRWIKVIPKDTLEKPMLPVWIGTAVLVFAVGIIMYGVINARNPKIRSYDIDIAKDAGNLKDLRIAVVSDIHLGNIVGKNRLEKMVEMVNGLKPDLVLIPGDIVDDSVEPFVEQNMGEVFKRLKTKLGVYGVLGNHDYYGGRPDEAVRIFEESGIKMLIDNYVKVSDSFYIVGRTDPTIQRVLGQERKKLSDVMNGMNTALPMILMDHQPSKLSEPEKSGIDLQVSGHTHGGQVFPDSLITKRVFEQYWGYLRKGNFQLIVTSGFGTWGPPIRIGSYPEVLDIRVHFKKS
ncbi:MAG: metallophosphoesterase [Clostridia bacterium]|nr:metallophosphoesterase [Clostridia bacterium]